MFQLTHLKRTKRVNVNGLSFIPVYFVKSHTVHITGTLIRYFFKHSDHK